MPRRKSSLADDLILAPWWVSFALAMIALVALPAVLPPAFRGLVPLVVFLLLAIAAISAIRPLRTGWILNRPL
ncbi:MAG: hypothetical protein H0U23_01685 [Blastocatellia bacterium]|nr:hypothetical protein [Blastocatellia bacterium]